MIGQYLVMAIMNTHYRFLIYIKYPWLLLMSVDTDAQKTSRDLTRQMK